MSLTRTSTSLRFLPLSRGNPLSARGTHLLRSLHFASPPFPEIRPLSRLATRFSAFSNSVPALESPPAKRDTLDFQLLCSADRLGLVSEISEQFLMFGRVFPLKEKIQRVPGKQPMLESISPTVRLASERLRPRRLFGVFAVGFQLSLRVSSELISFDLLVLRFPYRFSELPGIRSVAKQSSRWR